MFSQMSAESVILVSNVMSVMFGSFLLATVDMRLRDCFGVNDVKI